MCILHRTEAPPFDILDQYQPLTEKDVESVSPFHFYESIVELITNTVKLASHLEHAK